MTTSAQILTDINSAIATGPSVATLAASSAAAGPIMDMLGMLELARTQIKGLKTLLTQMIAGMDSGDGIKSTITNIRDTLV